MTKKSEERIIHILKQNKLKVTPQRLAICQAVFSSSDHPSAEQIFDTVREEHKNMSFATVYKTLDLLNRIGLVQELSYNGHFSRYDPKSAVHINIVCPKCMSIRDYESEKLKENWEDIISEIQGEIIGQRIDVYKLCKKCREEK